MYKPQGAANRLPVPPSLSLALLMGSENPMSNRALPIKPCESCELTADPRVKRTIVENPKNYGGRCRAPEEVVFKGLTSLEADESSSRSPWEEKKKKGQLLPPLNHSKTPDFKLFVTWQGVMFS